MKEAAMSARRSRRGNGTKLDVAISPTSWLAIALAMAAVAAPALAAKKSSSKSADNTTAALLLEQSAGARVEGDITRSLALLREAVKAAPDYRPARWLLGQLQVGEEWLSVEEAQRRAAADPHQADYFQLRQQYGEKPEGQLALARWCRKQGLTDEARFHWASVLAVDPNNEEALKAMDMRWEDGRLMTREQVARAKEQFREFKQAVKKWEPKIEKWRRAIGGKDSAHRETALHEIRSLDDPAIIPALEELTLGSDAANEKYADECQIIGIAFVEALSKMPNQLATEALARHAVFSLSGDMRSAAIEKLHSRPRLEYVPLLLAALALPIESSFNVRTLQDGSVTYQHSLYQAGAMSDKAIDAGYFVRQHSLPGRTYVRRDDNSLVDQTEPLSVRSARMATTARRSQNRLGITALAVETQVSNQNHAIAALNARIIPVLASTTGKDFAEPEQWWKWWQEDNEYYTSDHPVDYEYYSGSENYFYGKPYDEVRPQLHSCFVKGTPVLTKTGPRPIESLQLGELVLTQDVDSGELTHKPVIARTIRPQSDIVNLKFDGGQIFTTGGHPFWVDGAGWRMAKELDKYARLYGITGPALVKSVDTSEKAETFNIVVADFNTYFVGEKGLLVHDVTPRKPTRAIVPGVVAANK
jgi:hypothetical protein